MIIFNQAMHIKPNRIIFLCNQIKYSVINFVRHSFITRKHSKRWIIGLIYQLYPTKLSIGLQLGYFQLLFFFPTSRYRRLQARNSMINFIELLCKQFGGNRSYTTVSYELYDVIRNEECCNNFNPLKLTFIAKSDHNIQRIKKLLRIWSVAINGWYIYDNKIKSFKYINLKDLSTLSQEYAIEKLRERGMYYNV